MPDLPDFRLVVVGTADDAHHVETKLAELLRVKLTTHRVTLYAGSLETGVRPGGGFMVVARLPLEPAGP